MKVKKVTVDRLLEELDERKEDWKRTRKRCNRIIL